MIEKVSVVTNKNVSFGAVYFKDSESFKDTMKKVFYGPSDLFVRKMNNLSDRSDSKQLDIVVRGFDEFELAADIFEKGQKDKGTPITTIYTTLDNDIYCRKILEEFVGEIHDAMDPLKQPPKNQDFDSFYKNLCGKA